MLKKFFALFIAVILLTSALVGCADEEEEIPDGMQAAYLDGEPFRLYIPEGWASNVASGISGGYAVLYDGVAVSARYDASVGADVDLSAYLDSCSKKYETAVTNYAVTERADALLGGRDARKLTYTCLNADGAELTCTQTSAKNANGVVISLFTYCPTELCETVADALESVRAAFVILDDPIPPINDEITDGKTPDGMKIASAKNAAYRLYVPVSWICSSESGVSEAYVESDKSNVTVTLYEPQASMSIEDYFNMCADGYKNTLSGYELIGEAEERTVAERPARSYTYKAEYDGQRYRIMQTVFSDGSLMYSITYTALDENFDAHIDDVSKILTAFRFR